MNKTDDIFNRSEMASEVYNRTYKEKPATNYFSNIYSDVCKDLGHRNSRVRYFALRIIKAARKIERMPKVLRSPCAAFQGWWLGIQIARESRKFDWDVSLFTFSIKCYIFYFDHTHLEHEIE